MKSTSLISKRALIGSTIAAAGLALASSTFTAAPAQAFSLYINPIYGSTENTGATALLDFKFVDTVQGVLLQLGIKNTTNGSAGRGATSATLVGVAFDLLSGVSAPQSGYKPGSSTFTKYYTNPSIPGLNNNKPFTVGIRSAGSGNFVGGNPTAGLTANQSTSVSFLLNGVTGTAAQVEQAFLQGFKDGTLKAAARFQQVEAPGISGGSDKVMAGVPEPTTIGGLLLGGCLLAKWRSRKQQQKA